MKKFGILFAITIAILLSGCSTTQLINYNKKTEKLSLKINNEKIIDIQFDSPRYYSSDRKCIIKSFRLEENNHPDYGYLLISHDKLQRNCIWKGLAQSHFLDMAKKYYKSTNAEIIANKSIGNYNFLEIESDVNGKHMTVSIIEIWGTKQNSFIVDPKGILTKEIKEALAQ